jgi:hypothetical protein
MYALAGWWQDSVANFAKALIAALCCRRCMLKYTYRLYAAMHAGHGCGAHAETWNSPSCGCAEDSHPPVLGYNEILELPVLRVSFLSLALYLTASLCILRSPMLALPCGHPCFY